MYEIKITAETVTELKGRILALAAELTSAPVETVVVADGYSATVVSAPKAEKPKAEKPKAEPTPAPEPEAEPAQAEAEQADAAAPTYEQVRSAILRVATMKNREAVNTILTHFGATKNAQEIDPSRYPEVIEMANKMLED